MKKIMMTLAAVAVAATMNAQVYVGGTLGLNFQNKLTGESGDATGMTFKIQPEIGYNLNEDMAVGIVLGFGINTNGKQNLSEDVKGWNTMNYGGGVKYKNSQIAFEVAPYFRYNFVKLEKVNFFFDAGVGFGYISQKQTDDYTWNATRFSIFVQPGVAVNLNEKVSFVAKLGDGLGFRSTKVKDHDAQSTFGLDLKSLAGLSFGMYYNF